MAGRDEGHGDAFSLPRHGSLPGQPALWGGVHSRLIAVLGEMLTRRVAPRYFVDSEDHVYVMALDDPGRALIRPDIFLVEAETAGAARRSRGQIATPALMDLPEFLEVRYPYLEVRDALNREVVSTIELLSPINKVHGSTGHGDFMRKRERLLRSTAHWIEIDLLRAGHRPLIIEGADYYAALHRAEDPARLAVWAAPLHQELPTIAVPLRAPSPDVPLDLQEAVETLYERYRYDTAIDYDRAPPPPPLSAADAAWAEERIAAWRSTH